MIRICSRLLIAGILSARAGLAEHGCTRRTLEKAAANHLYEIIEQLSASSRYNRDPDLNSDDEKSRVDLGIWAEILREASLRLGDAGFSQTTDAYEANIGEASVQSKHVNLTSLLRDVEEYTFTVEELDAKYFRHLSNTELMTALVESVVALSPTAIRVIANAGGGICRTPSDDIVDQLLSAHKNSCSYTAGLREAVNNAFLKGGIDYPNDFNLGCGLWCQHRLKAVLVPTLALHHTKGDDALPVESLNRIFNDFCGPVLDAILESCGNREGGTRESMAIVNDLAVSGNLKLIQKMHKKGYQIVDPHNTGNQHISPVGSMLARFGHVQEAGQLIKESPEFEELVDAYGISAIELIDALTETPNELPESVMVASSDYPPNDIGNNGGWPSTKIDFPGWDGNCGIAELSGKQAAQDPTGFIKHFVLKQRPVILRNLIQYDRELAPLLTLMTNESLVRNHGKTTWNVESIPYSQVHEGTTPPKSTLKSYINEIIHDVKSFDGVPSPYIFSSLLQSGKKSISASDLFPQVPTFVKQGLQETVRFETVNEEFYIGPPGSGAPVHYHYAAWNALVYGLKAWVLFEPRQSAFSNTPAARKVVEFAVEDFLNESKSSNRHIRCVQRAGDVIIIPNGWAHLTYNLASSVGLAKEFIAVPTGNTRSDTNFRALQRAKSKLEKRKVNAEGVATNPSPSGWIDSGAFIRSVEDNSMTAENATKEFIHGYSNGAVKELLTIAVRNTAPRATRVAATTICSSISDLELESLLKVHRDSCWFSSQLKETIENAFLDGGSITVPPSDFQLKCSPHCMSRLQSLVSNSKEKQIDLEVFTMSAVNAVFIDFCGQVLEALIDSCGHRSNATFLSASQAAHDFARAGAFDVVSKLLSKGYNILEPVKANFRSGSLVPSPLKSLASTFIRAGHLKHAARLIIEYPEFGTQTDNFGVSALGLLQSHTAPPLKLSASDRTDRPYGLGGWQSELEGKNLGQKLPEYDREQCEGIAEVSGQAVSEDPELFIKDYILKDLPVMVRDFVRYDSGLSPLIDKFKRRSISHIPGTIDTELASNLKAKSARRSDLSERTSIGDFVKSITEPSAASDAKKTPPHISDDRLQVGKHNVNLAELYPDLPSFMDEGLGGHIRFNVTREQVYLGGTTIGAPQRFHNSAFDALVYGRKAWVLTRPYQSPISLEPTLESIGISVSVDVSGTTDQRVHCVQRSGDIFFIPHSWGHKTSNLEVSIGKLVEFRMYGLPDTSSNGLKRGFDAQNRNDLGNGKINVADFVTAFENWNNFEHAATKFLKGHSQKELLVSALGSVAAFAPKALFSAASLGSCATSNDILVKKLLSKSVDACENTALFGRTIVNDAILMQKIGLNTPDFQIKCGPRCMKRYREVVSPVAQSYGVRGEVTAPKSEVDSAYRRLCTPLVHAILDSCGQRNGTEGHRIAKELLSSGNLPAVLKMKRLGYSLYDPSDLGSELLPPFASTLAHSGFLEKAKRLIQHFPELGQLVDSFNISAQALIEALESSPSELPPKAVRAKHKPSTSSQASYNNAGGWPTTEIDFPGWHGECEIAELDGAAAIQDPETLIREFVLKRRPVVLRDFVHHDHSGLEPLTKRMTKDAIMRKWGRTLWDAGEIPYANIYKLNPSLPSTLEQYIQNVILPTARVSKSDLEADLMRTAPNYVFSDPVVVDRTKVSADALFPQKPAFLQDGLKGVVKFRRYNAQFYVGPAGSGAPLHYHDFAWNALVYGKKGWVLMQPDRALFSNEPAAKVVKRLADDDAVESDPRPSKRNLRCIQNAGDVLLVPRKWGHLTYNLQASIGLAKEMHVDALSSNSNADKSKGSAGNDAISGTVKTTPIVEEF